MQQGLVPGSLFLIGNFGSFRNLGTITQHAPQSSFARNLGNLCPRWLTTFLFLTKYSSKAHTRGRVSVSIRAKAIRSRLAVAMKQQLAIYNVCQSPSIVGEMAQAKADKRGRILAHVYTYAV